MTEQEWLDSSDCRQMLQFLGDQVSARKCRLFSCACCRRVWSSLADQRLRDGVQCAEAFADGGTGAEQLAEVSRLAYALALEGVMAAWPVTSASAPTAGAAGWWPVDESKDYRLAGWAGAIVTPMQVELLSPHGPARLAEQKENTRLLRHFFGNPFRPHPAPAFWPPLVVDLARQQYAGGDVRLILHDALLDAGQAELAEHFRAEEVHPKGCWVLDRVLGKE